MCVLAIFLIQSTPGVWFYSCLCFAPELLQGLVAFKRRFFIDMCLDDYDSFQHCQPPVLCLQRALFAISCCDWTKQARPWHLKSLNTFFHQVSYVCRFVRSSLAMWKTAKSGGKTAKDTLFASLIRGCKILFCYSCLFPSFPTSLQRKTLNQSRNHTSCIETSCWLRGISIASVLVGWALSKCQCFTSAMTFVPCLLDSDSWFHPAFTTAPSIFWNARFLPEIQHTMPGDIHGFDVVAGVAVG